MELENIIQAIQDLNSGPNMDHVLNQVDQFEPTTENRNGPDPVPEEPDARDQLYARLRQEAEANEEKFTAFVATISPNPDDCLFEIYEALTPDVLRWREFYLSEVQRLLNLAQSSDRRGRHNVIFRLMGMVPAYDSDGRLWRECREKFVELARLPGPAGCFGLQLLFELSPVDDDPELIGLLEKEVWSRDWRRRYLARYFYNGLKDRPLKDGISLVDRLKAALFNFNPL